MTAIASHLSAAELEARYETAANQFPRAIFMRFGFYPWVMQTGKSAAILSFSAR